MNHIHATVTNIHSSDNVNVVTFEAAGQMMHMMALELNSSLAAGSNVILGAKATNVALAKEISTLLSISNQLYVTIESINQGELLSSVIFRFADNLHESIITRDSALNMDLKAGDHIIALIKSSELSIVEIL